MKALILAGGTGTRLYPVTIPINKHFLPIYNKPMIYYALSLVFLAKIREVVIVVNPEDIENFKKLLGYGERLGVNIEYKIQEKPKGLADGIVISEDSIKGHKIFMVLGDNILFGQGLTELLVKTKQEIEKKGGAFIFGYYVRDPQRFGIIEFDKDGKVLSMEEKPKNPKSNYAAIGVYFFDENVVDYAKNIQPSDRGEYEITSVLEEYLRIEKLKAKILGRGFAWFDAGTHDSFLEAGEFVATIEKKTGLMIGCIEEIAYRNGWIDSQQLIKLAELMKKTEYGKYLINLVEGKI